MSMTVLFANLPWYQPPEGDQPGWRGVRAGSRWPHTFEYYSHRPQEGLVPDLVGGYLPFPFWLATASALAKQEGFVAECRDSIALGETYEHFYAHVQASRPQVLVLETATATLAQDLEIIVRVRALLDALTVILTGLHVELEQPAFLDAHPEVDFTVYLHW